MVDTDERVEFFPPRQHVGISRHALGSPPGKDKNNCRRTGSRATVQKKMYVVAQTRASELEEDQSNTSDFEKGSIWNIWKIIGITSVAFKDF